VKFLDSIKEGIAKAEASDRHVKDVANLFRELNEELALFEGGGVKLARKISVQSQLADISAAFAESRPVKEFLSPDRLVLTDLDAKKTFSEVAKWRQHINGFPCMLNFEGQEYICNNLDDLKAAIQELLSTVGFGKALSKALLDAKNLSKK
jgi:hypothetical protein